MSTANSISIEVRDVEGVQWRMRRLRSLPAGLSERLSALVSSPDDDLIREVSAELERMSAGPTKEMGTAALRAVLQARDALTDHRQRERELQALIATARDLISVSDVDDVLRAIVERARGLFL